MININIIKGLNEKRWSGMAVNPALITVLDEIARRLVAPVAKARYTQVSAQTTVPWYVIAVIHEREASQSWLASLAQGDPWDKVSIHRPYGIGPFDSWEDAAVYSLRKCAPLAAQWDDWTTGGILTILEMYNGLGYARMGAPSPYIWASTNQYHSGKYVTDGHYDPNAIDHQLGCAALLSRMAILDNSIQLRSV
jgi:lysozyme family protein